MLGLMRHDRVEREAERRVDAAVDRFLVEYREWSERERKERLTRYFRTAYETATTDGSREGIRRAAKDFGIVLEPDQDRMRRTRRRGAKRGKRN